MKRSRMNLVILGLWLSQEWEKLNRAEAQQVTHDFTARAIDVNNESLFIGSPIVIGDLVLGLLTFNLTVGKIDQKTAKGDVTCNHKVAA